MKALGKGVQGDRGPTFFLPLVGVALARGAYHVRFPREKMPWNFFTGGEVQDLEAFWVINEFVSLLNQIT